MTRHHSPATVITARGYRVAVHRIRGRDGRITEKLVAVRRGLDAKTVKALRNAARYAARRLIAGRGDERS